MLKKLNHIAIVVPDLNKAKDIYVEKFNAKVSNVKEYPQHGVKVIFVELDNTKIELMEPFGDNSPVEKFLEKNPNGGIHHICLEVSNINESLKSLKDKKVTVLGTGEPTIGSHNKPILFLHPKEFCGTLIELEEE